MFLVLSLLAFLPFFMLPPPLPPPSRIAQHSPMNAISSTDQAQAMFTVAEATAKSIERIAEAINKPVCVPICAPLTGREGTRRSRLRLPSRLVDGRELIVCCAPVSPCYCFCLLCGMFSLYHVIVCGRGTSVSARVAISQQRLPVFCSVMNVSPCAVSSPPDTSSTWRPLASWPRRPTPFCCHPTLATRHRWWPR